MINIRAEKNEDINSIFALNKSAFARESEAELINKLRETPDFIPELSLIAESESTIAGHLLLYPVQLSGDTILSLAPMAVLPGMQKAGIGSMLIEEGIKRATELGFKAIIVLGHPENYPKFGFKKASQFGIKAPWDKIPDEAFMVIELEEGALDKLQGTVEFPNIFDESL